MTHEFVKGAETYTNGSKVLFGLKSRCSPRLCVEVQCQRELLLQSEQWCAYSPQFWPPPMVSHSVLSSWVRSALTYLDKTTKKWVGETGTQMTEKNLTIFIRSNRRIALWRPITAINLHKATVWDETFAIILSHNFFLNWWMFFFFKPCLYILQYI